MADGFGITTSDWERQAASAWPSDEAGWDARYEMLWDAYTAKPYGNGIIKAWHLFRALADSGEEQDVTMRVHRDFQFIVNAYAPAVAGVGSGVGPVLEEARDGADLEVGEVIWRRSKVGAFIESWAKTAAALGSGGWEVVGTQRAAPYAPQLVWRDPRCTRVIYDDTRTRIDRVVYESTTLTESAVRKVDQRLDSPAIETYRRVLTPERVEVYRNEKPVPEESYAHKLGRVPYTHVVWEPWTEPEHGLPAGHPLDLAVAMADSIHCQIRAIGTRMGNPIGVLKGAKLGTAAHDAWRLGNILSGLPPDGDFSYAEIKSSISELLKALDALLSHIRETEPAYLFADSAASESGEAKSYRAALFESRVGSIRHRFHGALAEATEIALAFSAGRAYAEEGLYRVDLPPVLPRNTKAEVDTYVQLRGDLRPADRVRFLQRIGVVPKDADPEEYARAAQDEGGAAAVDMMGADAQRAAEMGAHMDEAGAELEEAGTELEAIAAALPPELAARLADVREMLDSAREHIGGMGGRGGELASADAPGAAPKPGAPGAMGGEDA